jgi:putative ABC transport system substrate-binding protein
MITGFSHIGPDLARKRIGLLKDIVPGLRAVAVMYSLTDPLYREWGADAEKAAQSLGFEAVQLGLTSPEVSELTQQMASAKAAGATGMLVIRDFITESLREDIFRAATEARIATLAEHRNYAEKGALISYGASLPDLFRRAANYVDRILKGENPADLPIQLPTKFELIVNLRTAKNLGLDIQPSLLARADEVIE